MDGSSIAGSRAPRARSRRGMGTVAALIIWVVALALVYALTQSQAQSGALSSVMRVTALRTVMTAGQSALVEATHRLRHPANGVSPLLQSLLTGQRSGTAHEPQASRDCYQELKLPGKLTIGTVKFEVASAPPTPDSGDPWLIDLMVEAQYVANASRAASITRRLRRRLTGRIVRVGNSMGRAEGQDVLRTLYIHADPIMEVVE